MREHGGQPRILFTSPWGPYPKHGVEEDPIDYFYYRNTMGQGALQLRAYQSWHSLHFMAQNLPVRSTVLENPTRDDLAGELRDGNYDIVAISFTQILVGQTLDMMRWIRSHYPGLKIVVGGYGTSLLKADLDVGRELAALADHICTGEGLEFLRDYLHEHWDVNAPPASVTQDLLPSTSSLFRTHKTIFRQLVFVRSLGCRSGCSFCATSHHFERKRVELCTAGELFTEVVRRSREHPDANSAIIYDEDFFADPANVEAFREGMARHPELRRRPLWFTVFASVRSIARYSVRDVVECGIGTVFIGVESLQEETIEQEQLSKRQGEVSELFRELHRHGINTLGSLVVGWDGQTRDAAAEDGRAFVALNPTFYQVVPLHPVPGTPLWERIVREGRLIEGYQVENDGIAEFNYEPTYLTRAEASDLVRGTYRDLVTEGGPWPFRVARNLLQGCVNLEQADDDILQERAVSCRRMLMKLLPLALASRAVCTGGGFRTRHRQFRREVRRRFPMRYALASVVAMAVWPALLLLTGWGRLRHAVSPHGDQPDRLRTLYNEIQ